MKPKMAWHACYSWQIQNARWKLGGNAHLITSAGVKALWFFPKTPIDLISGMVSTAEAWKREGQICPGLMQNFPCWDQAFYKLQAYTAWTLDTCFPIPLPIHCPWFWVDFKWIDGILDAVFLVHFCTRSYEFSYCTTVLWHFLAVHLGLFSNIPMERLLFHLLISFLSKHASHFQYFM